MAIDCGEVSGFAFLTAVSSWYALSRGEVCGATKRTSRSIQFWICGFNASTTPVNDITRMTSDASTPAVR